MSRRKNGMSTFNLKEIFLGKFSKLSSLINHESDVFLSTSYDFCALCFILRLQKTFDVRCLLDEILIMKSGFIFIKLCARIKEAILRITSRYSISLLSTTCHFLDAFDSPVFSVLSISYTASAFLQTHSTYTSCHISIWEVFLKWCIPFLRSKGTWIKKLCDSRRFASMKYGENLLNLKPLD